MQFLHMRVSWEHFNAIRRLINALQNTLRKTMFLLRVKINVPLLLL